MDECYGVAATALSPQQPRLLGVPDRQVYQFLSQAENQHNILPFFLIQQQSSVIRILNAVFYESAFRIEGQVARLFYQRFEDSIISCGW